MITERAESCKNILIAAKRFIRLVAINQILKVIVTFTRNDKKTESNGYIEAGRALNTASNFKITEHTV